MPSVYDHITAERVELRAAELEGQGSDSDRLAAAVALCDAMQRTGAATVGELPDRTRDLHAEAIADVGSPRLQWRWQRVPAR